MSLCYEVQVKYPGYSRMRSNLQKAQELADIKENNQGEDDFLKRKIDYVLSSKIPSLAIPDESTLVDYCREIGEFYENYENHKLPKHLNEAFLANDNPEVRRRILLIFVLSGGALSPSIVSFRPFVEGLGSRISMVNDFFDKY